MNRETNKVYIGQYGIEMQSLVAMDQMKYYYGVSDDEINDIIQAKQERMMKNYREGLQ